MADFDPDAFISGTDTQSAPVEIPSGTLRPTTYGPSSPGATPADKKEFIGNADNVLKAGDVALQPETAGKYGLRTGDKFKYEGKTYNYADTPAARVGNVIDVYHPKEGGGFDPDMFIASSPGTATPVPSATATGKPNIPSTFDPNSFVADTPATPTPPDNKNDVAGRVGAAIAKGGAAFANAQGGVQPANYQYRPPRVPQSQGSEVKPIPGLHPQDWANLIYRAAFKVAAPTNLMAQDAFDQTYNALPQGVKEKLNTPLVSPPQARVLIQTGAAMAGAGAPNLLRFVESTQAGAGAMDTAANTLSSATTGSAALSMPAFLIPGVAETWAAKQASQTPAAWGQVQQAVAQNGMLSREGVAALTQEMVRLGSIGLAAKGGASLRNQLASYVKVNPEAPPVQPRTPPPLPPGVYEASSFTPQPFEQSQMINAVKTPSGKIVGLGVEHGDTISHLSEQYDPGELTSGWVLKKPTRSATNATFIGTDDVQKTNGDFEAAFRAKGALSPQSAIANKYQPETAGLGQGSSPAAAIARGSQFTPEEINQHISDLMQNTGDRQAQTAAVRVEGARLQARSEAAGKALQANRKSIDLMQAADNAFKDWADFQRGPQAKLKGDWAAQGHELQQSVPVDLSSVNGLRQKFFNEMGVEATPDQTKVLAKYADKVERTEKARVSELDKALDEIAKRSKNVDASPDAMAKMREGIANRMGKKQPCRN